MFDSPCKARNGILIQGITKIFKKKPHESFWLYPMEHVIVLKREGHGALKIRQSILHINKEFTSSRVDKKTKV